ncbi:MAG: hypothetical protein KUG74_09570 [Rhodobacteraceae bacterium]|nr:hypothetical protein [Paracoccaceae bacterium]
MNDLPSLRQVTNNLLPQRVVLVSRLNHPVDRHGIHPVGGIIGVAKATT